MAGKKGDKTISLAAVLDLNEAAALRGKLMGLRGGNVVVSAGDGAPSAVRGGNFNRQVIGLSLRLAL